MIVTEIHGTANTLGELKALVELAVQRGFDDDDRLGISNRQGWLVIQHEQVES